MTDKGKYCCFCCPKGDFEEHRLTDTCPTCDRPYNFPLENFPEKIGDYKVLKALGRGFYGATFVAERKGTLRTQKVVLKVVPTSIYEFFNKSFEEECRRHADIAESAAFIVGIDDMFRTNVDFLDITLDCYVAVLEYLDGSLLHDYLSGKSSLTASLAAQISADLFKILDELKHKNQNHNDFHEGNIIVETRSPQNYRSDVMDGSVRAVAIDLGSLADDRRSGGGYKSDLHWIAAHIARLAEALIHQNDTTNDTAARVSLALRMISNSISASVEGQRLPSADDLISKITESYYRVNQPWRPWTENFRLANFNDSYNAQTLQAWNVPQLLVDPQNEWQKSICAPGPMIVTGMRGCGKTMLLRSLQFHARAARVGSESNDDVLKRVSGDSYVGLFVSASSLLPPLESKTVTQENMFARLAVAYCLEASRSIAHLNDVNPNAIEGQAPKTLVRALRQTVDNCPDNLEVSTISDLEIRLVEVLIDACRSDSALVLNTHPSNAFPVIADAIRASTKVWSGKQVLFLLDEVTTRFLHVDRIDALLSALMFLNPNCAFKLTSETQTIFLSLKSPGGVHPAMRGRDFDTFDLGAKVHERLKDSTGKKFVEDILSLRAKFFHGHPNSTPRQILGDKRLSEIAETITSSNPNSPARKAVYHGISALRAVCVGDIGSVITIYNNILRKSKSGEQVSARDQNDEFQDFCSHNLYILDRRGSDLKDVAKSFAAASYELLMQSAKKKEPRGLRQYTSLYVRVSAGDREEQGKRLRELVDAGVFVFQGGGTPRTKTKDSDPIQQFKLTFRKIFGLADFMGLSERDRFELSGDALKEWLDHPERGKDILMRNLRTDDDPDGDYDESDTDNSELQPEPDGSPPAQFALDLTDRRNAGAKTQDTASSIEITANLPIIERIEPKSLRNYEIDTLVVALGFEERASSSASRAIAELAPKRVLAVKYNEPGRTKDIIAGIEHSGTHYEIIDYHDFLKTSYPSNGAMFAVDVTGLTKAGIFSSVSKLLSKESELAVVYTEAEKYYPLETSLDDVLASASEGDYHGLLETLKKVLSGERGPYAIQSLGNVDSDGSRMKALLAFGTAKHERLIHLIEERDYNVIRVLVDNKDSARARVARLASDVATKAADIGDVSLCDIRDPHAVISAILEFFAETYVDGQMNFEIGLTGDKIEAIAAAVFCSSINANDVLYVRPSEFLPERFTEGTGNTNYFLVKR